MASDKGTLRIAIVGDADKFNRALDSARGGMDKFAKGAAVLTAGLAGAGVAAFGAAQKMANTADQVAKGSRATGLSTDAYQELSFALGQSGLEAAQFDIAMKKLSKNVGTAAIDGVGPAADAMAALGVSAKDANGEMRTQDDIFSDLLVGLEGVTSAQERAALASDLFGARVGPDLASAIETGGEGIDALRQQARDLGIVMSEEAAVNGEKFNDTLDAMKRGIGAVGREAFEFLVPAFTSGFGEVQKLVDRFKTDGIGGLVDDIGARLREFLPKLGDRLKEWGGAFLDWARQTVPPLLEKLGELLRKVAEWMADTGVPTLIKKLKGWAEAFVAWVGPALSALLPKLGDMLGQLVAWLLTTGLPKLVETLGRWAWAFLDFIVTGVIPALPGVLAGVLAGIVSFIGSATGGIATKLGEWTATFIGWVASLPEKITKAAAGMFDGIRDAFKGAINWIIGKWNDLSFTLPSVKVPGLGTIGGFTLSTPDIPMLADGGIVTRPTLAVVGEAGPEAVVPLSKGRGFGSNVTVHVHLDGAVVAGDQRAISDLMQKVVIETFRRDGQVFNGAIG